jgi:hypothetical protein
MGFHINVGNMPRIDSYARAKEEFDSRKVVRGENQSVRRLGDRYEKEKWLRKEIQDGIEVYIAGYYDTDLIRYYPTHKEITLGGYPSRSTQRFVYYVGDVWLQDFVHKDYVPSPFTNSPMLKNNQIECGVNLGHHTYYMNARDWYKITYDDKPIEPDKFEKAIRYVFDAKQMRELRKPLKKLIKYADTMLKISNEGLAKDEEVEKQLSHIKDNEDALAMFADEDKTYLSYYYLVRQCQHTSWVAHNQYRYSLNIGIFKRYLDKIIKLTNPQVLVEV